MPSAGLIRFAMLLLLFATNCAATETLCSATRPSGPATSNSASQQAKECEVPSILDCSGGSSALSASTASYVSSASESTDSASYASAAESSSTVASAEPSSSAPASSSSEPCPCVLIQELVNLRNAYLDSAQQSIFDECLDDIRVVLVNAINITVKQQVSEIALLLRNCFAANADIEALLKFQTISSWGRIFEFMAAGISFCSENVDSVIAVDASGSCTLTEAIVNATAGDLCGSGSSAQIQSICDDANYVLRKQISGYDKGRKLGWIGKVFEKNLFVLYPQIESCVRNVTIPGFGSVDQFLSVCDQYETSSSLGSGVLNGTGSDCALVKSLNESLHSNATVNSTDSATLQEALNYVSNCSAYFAQTSDVAARLKFVSAQCSQLSSACRLLLYPIQISGTYQSIDFSDVVVTSHFCDNDGCGNITYGSASLTWPETCMIDSAQNISDIEYAVNIFYANLTVVQKTSFNSYKNSITNCIRSSSYGTNYTARIECVQTYVQNYASNNSAMRAVFLAVECVTVLVETVTSVVFGTFGNLCGCSS